MKIFVYNNNGNIEKVREDMYNSDMKFENIKEMLIYLVDYNINSFD